jgi:hypothetical protein
LAQGIDAFCQGIGPTLDQLNFAQRRQLVELLIDRVIVTDGQVEIRYVVPTGPKGETTPFGHLRLDYLNRPPDSTNSCSGQLCFFFCLPWTVNQREHLLAQGLVVTEVVP